MYKLFPLIVICCSLQANAQQVMTDPAAAFTISRNTNKPMLLVFSGSDWCLPCIQFNKRILSDSSFLKFATNTLVLLEADFPQRKKISPSLKTAYESLAEKYDPDGTFPKIVILNKEGSLSSELSYTQQSPSEFISEIQEKLPK